MTELSRRRRSGPEQVLRRTVASQVDTALAARRTAGAFTLTRLRRALHGHRVGTGDCH